MSGSGSASLFNYRTFSVNDINYEPPRLVRGNSFLAKTCGEKRVLFQTPKLISLNQIEVDSKGCHLELQLTEEDKDFYDFLQCLDDKNIGYTYGAASDWFQKNFSYEIIDDFYIPTVKHRSSEKNVNLNYLKIRVPTHKREPNINIYDHKRDKIDWRRIQPGTPLIAIIELKGLKFLQREVVCDWEIVQLKAYIEKSKVNLTKILIELSKGDEQPDDDDEDREEVAKYSRHDGIYHEETSQNQLNNNPDCNQLIRGESNILEEEQKENKTIVKKPTYNDRVIDREMVSELAKISDISPKEYIHDDNESISTSETSNSDGDNDFLILDNQYKMKEKRNDLLKVMKEADEASKEADEASKKADFLRIQAAAAAAEIKQIVNDISLEDNNIVTSPAY